MGGGGDDGGYQARQDAIDAEKKKARSALNALFGVYTDPGGSVDRAAFTRTVGGSGGSDAADFSPGVEVFDQAGYDAAQAATGGRQAEADANKAALDALYAKVRGDAFTAGKRRVDEQQGDASRALKFELFAKGLNGGSVDVDQNAMLGRQYTQGLTDVGAKADSIASGLKSSDQSARLQLLQSIDSGMDQSSAISSALAQMKNNAESAAADATGANIGDLFSSAGALYNQSQKRLGAANANSALAQLLGGRTTNSRASSGILTGT